MYRKFSNALAVTVIASVAWIAYEVWFWNGVNIFMQTKIYQLNGHNSFTKDLNILKIVGEYFYEFGLEGKDAIYYFKISLLFHTHKEIRVVYSSILCPGKQSVTSSLLYIC